MTDQDRILELESQLKIAKLEYQRVCDKLGTANRRIARYHSKLSRIRSITLEGTNTLKVLKNEPK